MLGAGQAKEQPTAMAEEPHDGAQPQADCPICLGRLPVTRVGMSCCGKDVCPSCFGRLQDSCAKDACPMCRRPFPKTAKEHVGML